MPVELKKRPFVLIVRDGWGANPHPEQNDANAIYLGKTPVDDHLLATYPHVLMRTSGEKVGLPAGVMGNSEVGHQNLGAGRIVDQEILRITKTMREGTFYDNPAVVGAYQRAAKTGGKVHLIGLCSSAGVHSTLEHLYGCVEAGKRQNFPGDKIFLHAFGDGRDTPPDSGLGFIQEIEAKFAEMGAGRIASVVGRFYAMDRDNRWGRVEQAYRLLAEGKGRRAASAADAVQHYYDNPTSDSQYGDEFIVPTAISSDGETPLAMIEDGDSVILFNFRGDRPREITKAFTLDAFPFKAKDKNGDDVSMGFARQKKLDLYYATMTAYEKGLPVEVIFEKPPKMPNIFGQYISELGLKQFRCAETEKFAHVTFFFNDYRDEPFEGEDRGLVESPRDVETYDQKPEMSAHGVTEVMLEAIASDKYDVMVLNYANGDMVGHTGNLQAAIKAVETVDECVGKVVEAVRAKGGVLIVTADHGNAEKMVDPDSGRPHTAHTTFDVQLIVVDNELKGTKLREGGGLSDLVPTALALMGLPQPEGMAGESLL